MMCILSPEIVCHKNVDIHRGVELSMEDLKELADKNGTLSIDLQDGVLIIKKETNEYEGPIDHGRL